MDTSKAAAMGMMHQNHKEKVFDWEKAARIIRERGARTARAGLASDWEYTGGTILQDGEPVPEDDTYTFLSSTWAIPELEVDGETMNCYRMESEVPGWNEETYWPEEALNILNGKEETKGE